MKNQQNKDNLFSLFLTFLRFGFMAWGGPVAQIAMIKEELVDQKNWISQDRFKRTLAVYQALPGPEAQELCVYFGMIQKGRIGGFLAGLGFMLPGFLLMLTLSYFYKIYGATALFPLFVGVAPAVSALIIRAAHRISTHILCSKSLIFLGIFSAILTFLQIHFLWVFVICIAFRSFWSKDRKIAAIIFCIAIIILSFAIHNLTSEIKLPFVNTKSGLFIEGLKAGLLSFGGAYTAIPFLQNSMVGNYDAITTQTFLDGIALANIIPAPLIIFATHLGFLAGNFGGAFLISAGIFLPAFSFTLLGHKHLEKLVENKIFHNTLDSISAAVSGMLITTALQIFLHTINNWIQVIIFTIALLGFYLIKWRFNVPLIIIFCGLFGYIINYNL